MRAPREQRRVHPANLLPLSLISNWEFPTRGDPDIDPKQVDPYCKDPKIRYPNFEKIPNRTWQGASGKAMSILHAHVGHVPCACFS